jgi:hypothetical protein
MAVRYRSNRSTVNAAIHARMQRGTLNMAGDIVRPSTPYTPYRDGDLRTRRRVSAIPTGARVEWQAGHAAVQNRGSRRGRPFRNYTTPGTGPHFVQKGVDAVVAKLPEYFK